MVVSDRDRERCSQGIFRASCLAGPHVPALPTNQVPVAYGGVGWGGEVESQVLHASGCPGSGSALQHPTELELAKGSK